MAALLQKAINAECHCYEMLRCGKPVYRSTLVHNRSLVADVLVFAIVREFAHESE